MRIDLNVQLPIKRNPFRCIKQVHGSWVKKCIQGHSLAALFWSCPERSLWLLTCSIIAPFKERFRFASVLSKRFCNRFPTANIDFFFGLADDYFIQFRPIYNMSLFEFRVRSFGMIGSGSVIRAHSDRGRSNEPMNPCLEWTHRFIWSTTIRVIFDHWSWAGSSQRNAPLVSLLCKITLSFKTHSPEASHLPFLKLFLSLNKATVTEKTKFCRCIPRRYVW